MATYQAVKFYFSDSFDDNHHHQGSWLIIENLEEKLLFRK